MKVDLMKRQQQAVFSLDALPVSPRNKNFTIMVDIQKDDMAASVRVVSTQKDIDIYEFDILAELYKAGVRTNVNYQRIAALVEDRRFNEHVMVSSGFTPEKGDPASLEYLLNLKEFPRNAGPGNLKSGVEVAIDDVLVRKKLATPGVNGVNVRGRQIKAEPGPDVEFKYGKNCYISDDGTELRAAITGVAGLTNGRVDVKVPDYDEWKFLVHFRRNNMEALLIIYPGSSKQPEITQDFIDGLLNKHGIKFGVEPVLNSASLQEIKGTTVIPIARGLMPSLGRNAKLVEKFRDGAEFGQQVFFAKEGDVIVKKVPAEAGSRGRNVLDEPVSSKKGSDVPLEAGKNTKLSEDGLKLLATKDGYVSKVGGVYQVVEGFSYNGKNKLPAKVNYQGVVNIKGDVSGGKVVNAGHHIIVEGNVTGSDLLAGGIIHVKGDIWGKPGSMIQSGGDLYAGNINNARVSAGGDVYLSGELKDCDLKSGGDVKSTDGKPVVLKTGRILSGGSIEIDDVGSVDKGRTYIETGIPIKIRQRHDSVSREIVKLVEKQGLYVREINKIKTSSKTRKLTNQEYAMLRKLKMGYDAVSERLRLRTATLKKLQAGMRKLSRNARVDVRGDIHPNSIIKIGPYARKFDKKVSSCRLAINEEKKEIAISKL